MSAFAEKLKAHYAGIALGSIDVPEWGVTLFIRPSTIGQSAAILAEPDQFRQGVRLIQVRAKQEDGSPLFDEDDFSAMISHGETAVINRVVEQIMAIGDIPEDEIKKG